MNGTIRPDVMRWGAGLNWDTLEFAAEHATSARGKCLSCYEVSVPVDMIRNPERLCRACRKAGGNG